MSLSLVAFLAAVTLLVGCGGGSSSDSGPSEATRINIQYALRKAITHQMEQHYVGYQVTSSGCSPMRPVIGRKGSKVSCYLRGPNFFPAGITNWIGRFYTSRQRFGVFHDDIVRRYCWELEGVSVADSSAPQTQGCGFVHFGIYPRLVSSPPG